MRCRTSKLPPFLLVVSLIAWMTMRILSRALAQDQGPATDASLDVIQFKSPLGWTAADRPGAKVYAAPGSTPQQQAMLVIMLAPPKDNLDLASAFGDVVKQMTGSNKLESSTDPTSGTTRQGFPVMSQRFVIADAAGNRAAVRIVAANVQNRIAAFCYLGGPPAFVDQHQPEIDAVMHSVNFNVQPNAAAAPPAVGGAPAPAASADFIAGVHDRTAKAVADAKDQFNKQLNTRLKPHTVLGDIVCLDGKPVPNVVKITASVGGFTVAAERAFYNLEVDPQGHFEQQVPDGLYHVTAKCIVTIAGRNVPADLVPLGKVNVDQSSAPGLVGDFRLVMAGLKPDAGPNGRDSYFGGAIKICDPSSVINDQLSSRYPGSKVQVTFEPQGPLIDGSPGQTFMLESPTSGVNYGANFQQMPIGPYHATAKLITADGQVRALNCCQGVPGSFSPVIDVFWQSDPQYQDTRRDPVIYLHE